MSTYYIDASVVTGGDGSEGDPFNLLADLSLSANDTVNLAGTFRGELIVETLDGLTIQQWNGRTKAILRGDTLISGTWLSFVSNEWQINIGTGLDLEGMVEDWDTRINGQGFHYGHLILGTSASLVQGEYDYDSGSGVLHVFSTTNPTSNGVVYGWCVGGHCIEITGINTLVRGLDIYLYTETTSGQGYGVRLLTCTDGLVEDCEIIDCGFHGIGFTSTPNTNNVISRCTVSGGSAAGTQFVSAITSGSIGQNLTGGIMIDCHANVYTNLDFAGVPMVLTSVAGYITHGSTDQFVQDLKFIRCTATPLTGSLWNYSGFSINSGTTVPSNLDDWTTYPVQLIDCSVPDGFIGVTSAESGTAVWVAYVRCYIETIAYNATISAGNNKLPYLGGCLLDSCVFIGNSDVGQDPILRTISGNNTELRIFNTILHNVVTATGVAHALMQWSGTDDTTALLRCRGSIFSCAVDIDSNSMGLLRDFHGTIDMNDCWYYRIAAGHFNFQGDTGQILKTDWSGTHDVNGVYDIDPGYTSRTTGNMQGTLNSAMKVTKKALALATERGINGRRYSGHYGPYQYGNTGHGLRKALDFFQDNLVTEL